MPVRGNTRIDNTLAGNWFLTSELIEKKIERLNLNYDKAFLLNSKG